MTLSKCVKCCVFGGQKAAICERRAGREERTKHDGSDAGTSGGS